MAALAWGGLPLAAQNVIVNGDFEATDGFIEYTDYERTYSRYVVEAGHYAIDNTTSGYGGGMGWPMPSNSDGKFMMVNGFGGNSNPTKVVWRQTVDVFPQDTYTFSYRFANLNRIIYGQIYPAKLRVKINGSQVGEDNQLPSDNNWHDWSQTWSSGNNTQAVIEIYDVCTNNSGMGDDFCMDNISFVPAVVYSATANDDAAEVCYNSSVDIDVLANDVVQPNANDAVVTVVTPPEHGSAMVLSDKRIRYTAEPDYNGSAVQFKYRVNNHGVTSEAWVTVALNRVPTVGEISSPDGICAGESFDLTVPAVDANGSEVTETGWEIAPTAAGPFDPLDNNGIPYEYNGYYLRYKAVNGCGSSCSNLVQLTVFSTGPTFDTIQACDVYPWNGLVCDHTDDYSAQVTTEDGCEIMAYLHFVLSDAYAESLTVSACDEYLWLKNGTTYYESGEYEYEVENDDPMICDSVFTLYLTINHVPELLESLVTPTEICAGDALQVAQPQYAMNHADGGSAFWEYATAPEGPFLPFNPEDNGLAFGDYCLRFAVTNGCGDSFSNVVPFRVNDKPIVQGTLSDMEVCAGFPLDLPEVSVNWRNVDEDDRLAQWQVAQPQGEPFVPFDTLTTMTSDFDGCWLRFVAGNSCGEDILGPVRISVLVIDDEWLDAILACDFYVLESNDTITESQVIDYDIDEPCPHKVWQPIEIHHSDSVVEPRSSCHEEFVWHDSVFHWSDEMQYGYWNTVNAYGCPRTVELQLTFGDFDSYTFNETACESFVWDLKPDTVYTESVRDSLFVPAVGDTDCDTWYYLELTLGHDTTVEKDTTKCEPFYWYGNFCNEDGQVYQHTFKTEYGCDSTVLLHLTLNQPVTGPDLLWFACDSITIDGVLYNVPGHYDLRWDTLPGPNGCDSIYKVVLILSNSELTGLIQGDSWVYVASNLISGIYRYQIDTAGIVGNVNWSVSNPDWRIVDTDAVSCRVLVTTPGVATLKASFFAACGGMEREFVIHAGFFDIEEPPSLAVSVFPNPTQGKVTVEAEGIRRVRVVDMMGQTLALAEGAGQDRIEMDLGNLAPSVYLLEVETFNGRSRERIVVYK